MSKEPTQNEIAKFYGLTFVTISKYKNSKKVGDNRKFIAMKNYFIKWLSENKNEIN